MSEHGFHEDLSREDAQPGSTDRSFGLIVGGICALIGAAGWWFGSATALWWLAIGGGLVVTALVHAPVLAPLNRAWTRLGLLLFKVVNPVVMAILYCLCIVPMGLVMRAVGRDPLRLRRDPAALTYWVKREPASPLSRGMRDQF